MNMKTSLNIAAFALTLLAIVLKASYNPGGSLALILASAVMLLATLYLYVIKDNKEAGMSDGMNYLLSGTLAIWILATVFKVQNWPGAAMLVFVALLLGIILPILLILSKEEIKSSKQYIIILLVLGMFVTSAFIRNNPVVNLLGTGWDNPINNETAAPMNDAAEIEIK
jgi:peptidoglycan/LPS O-acetylase OafA/YrhL